MDWLDANRDLFDWITVIAAFLGAGLGVFNSWQAWRHRRIDIKVVPAEVEVKRSIGQDNMGGILYRQFHSPGVKVINRSSFAVTLEEAGYHLQGGQSYPLTRLDTPGRYSSGGHLWIPDKLPQRLEPRSSLRLAWWDEDEERLKGKRIQHVYAKTACGARSRGRNRALRAMAEKLANGNAVMIPVDKQQ